MVVIDPHQLKIGKIIVLHELIELALPFLVAPVIRKTLIETAKIRISTLQKMRTRGESDARTTGGGLMQQWNGRRRTRRLLVAAIIAEETIIADGEAGTQCRVPQIACTTLVFRPIG